MSQNVIDFSGDPSGAQLLDSLLTPMKANILSMNSGTSRPAFAQAGTEWLDVTTTPWIVKLFDGTNDIITGYVNATTHTFTPAGLSLSNAAATNPTINDDSGDGYSVGSRWINTSTKLEYVLVDATLGAAVWKTTTFGLSDVVGKQTIYVDVQGMSPRTTGGCASVAYTAGAANQPDKIPYMAFDDSALEYAGFRVWLPKSWNVGTVTAKFASRRASGTGAANAVLGIRAVGVSNSDSPAANFGTGASVTVAADTTTGDFVLSSETSACTVGGSPSQGDFVFFEIYRDGTSGSDTLTGDVWITGIQLIYTTNAATDA